MASKFAVLRSGPNAPYNTIKQADDDGAITLNYGSFVDAVFNFFFVGITLYAAVQAYSVASKDTVIKHSVKCEYCRKYIPEVVSARRGCSLRREVDFGSPFRLRDAHFARVGATGGRTRRVRWRRRNADTTYELLHDRCVPHLLINRFPLENLCLVHLLAR
jgi:hypothetical protein